MSKVPRELSIMFGADTCQLCSVELTSPVLGKMHYSGKPHMKKVKKWLTDWSVKTGRPIPNFDNHTSTSSVATLADYCELCDVRLLTTNDKILHYSGKGHRKNERNPENAKKKGKTYHTVDLSATDDRFGIGVGFTDTKKVEVAENVQINDFVCELCDVKAVSQDQLNIHLGGKKHQEKLKKKDLGLPKPARPYKCDTCKVSLDTSYLYQLHLKGKPHAKTLKKLEEEYEGGTCEPCNVYFSSFRDYQMHTNGKKHEKRVKENALRCAKDGKDVSTSGEFNDSVKNLAIKNETDGKWKCISCHDLEFETEEKLENHKKTRGHLLRVVSTEGDKISDDKIHYYCFICRKQCNDNKEYCAHLFSEKHMILTNDEVDLGSKVDLWHCRVCSVIIDQAAKEEHLGSKNHLLQSAQQDVTQRLTQLATENVHTLTFQCTHCNLSFINFVAFSEHMLDQKHLESIIMKTVLPAKLKIE